MKKFGKLLAGVLACALCFCTPVLAGCGNKNKDLKDANVLNIVMPDLGYGTDWMKALGSAFTQESGHKVNVDVTPSESGFDNAIRSGTAEYDIYLMRTNTYSLVANNAANASGYDCVLAELDDVYDSEIEPGVKFKDKMKDIYEVYNRIDRKGDGENHYYAVQWCDSIFSVVRNLDVWQESWKLPNTTDELLGLCAQIKGDGATPMIWSSKDPYVWSVANLWVTQYQGTEDMYGSKGFWNAYTEGGGEQYSPDMWDRKGILYAMEVVDELVNSRNEYSHAASTSEDFTTAQGYFMIPSQKIAMMFNGDWLYKEMVRNYSGAHIEMFKTPVISKIKDHPDCLGQFDNDAELSALIKAIDEGSTALTGEGYSVNQKAFDKVYEARNMYTCSTNINHVMVSPSYSDSLPIVKAFYKFLASDKGLALYASSSGGFTLGFDTSASVLAASDAAANSFVKSSEKIKQNGNVAPWPMYINRLFAVGGMPVYPTIESGYMFPEQIFAQKGSGYKSAATQFSDNKKSAQGQWSRYMRTAGLIQ